jgi:hypothetical protein
MSCLLQGVKNPGQWLVFCETLRNISTECSELWFGNVSNIPEVAMTGTDLEFPV